MILGGTHSVHSRGGLTKVVLLGEVLQWRCQRVLMPTPHFYIDPVPLNAFTQGRWAASSLDICADRRGVSLQRAPGSAHVRLLRGKSELKGGVGLVSQSST